MIHDKISSVTSTIEIVHIFFQHQLASMQNAFVQLSIFDRNIVIHEIVIFIFWSAQTSDM